MAYGVFCLKVGGCWQLLAVVVHEVVYVSMQSGAGVLPGVILGTALFRLHCHIFEAPLPDFEARKLPVRLVSPVEVVASVTFKCGKTSSIFDSR